MGRSARPLERTCGLLLVASVLWAAPLSAQEEAEGTGEQDSESKALDSTATQWSFQFAWQGMTYQTKELPDGAARPEGANNYVQLRIVAPVSLSGFTILPRVTFRHYENAQGDSGLGNTEIFALLIPGAFTGEPAGWGSGRWSRSRATRRSHETSGDTAWPAPS